jgi:hypothetical protein
MCPKCFSHSLGIKHQRGWERLLVMLTATRRYFCRDCGAKFRAPDRRKQPRETEVSRGTAKQMRTSAN